MNFPVLPGGSLWPAATLVAAAFFMTGALTSASVPGALPPSLHPATIELAQSEVDDCERARARSHSECLGEAEGKALIRHAEWVAELEETGTDGVTDASTQTSGVIVLHPQRRIPE